MNIEVYQEYGRDLNTLKDKEFDIVLCFGPLYHLIDKGLVFNEIKRVIQDNGRDFLAFISKDMVILTETMIYNKNFLMEDGYNHNSLELVDELFAFNTVEEARKIIKNNKLEIVSEVGTDGFSELCSGRINAMDEKEYEKYLNYNFIYVKNQSF